MMEVDYWDTEDQPQRADDSQRSARSFIHSSVGLALSGLEVCDRNGDDLDLRFRADSVDLLNRKTPEGGPLTLATIPTPAAQTTLSALERACLAARVALELKGKDIVVLDMRGITRMYDFFVLVSGNSRRQLHALAETIDRRLNEVGDRRLSIEGYEASKWIVQDYGDVVIHMFDPATRQYYGLEDLWADAPRIDWEHQ
jgi:ribosome-associated protein